MGKIINFTKNKESNNRKKKIHIKIVGCCAFIASVCTILGVTVKDLFVKINEENIVTEETQMNEEIEGVVKSDADEKVETIEKTEENKKGSTSNEAAIENWQKVAEDFNNKGYDLYNLGEYEQAI